MGLFIVFEGVEGSGKSTMCSELHHILTEIGRTVRTVREPGSTPTGEKIATWIKSGKDIVPMAELFLFSAARISLVENVIRPSLQEGTIVICDRYIYSTLSYQGYGRGVDRHIIENVNNLATKGLKPDLVVLLDLPVELGIARKSNRDLDRIEQEDKTFHDRIRTGYLDLASRDPERWLVIDSSLPITRLSEIVWSRVSDMLQ
jgi:dTMP kinase